MLICDKSLRFIFYRIVFSKLLNPYRQREYVPNLPVISARNIPMSICPNRFPPRAQAFFPLPRKKINRLRLKIPLLHCGIPRSNFSLLTAFSTPVCCARRVGRANPEVHRLPRLRKWSQRIKTAQGKAIATNNFVSLRYYYNP